MKNYFCCSSSVKSTVYRGRLNKSKINSIKNYYSLFCINFQRKLVDWTKIFNRSSPIIIEIGFGTGENLINMALQFPEKNFLGIELYWPGIAICLKKVFKLNLNNVRIICYDAIQVMKYMIQDNQLNEVRILFPDPWPKRKHHKRRMIQEQFSNLIAKKLKNQGIFYVVTDYHEYAIAIYNQIKKNKSYFDVSSDGFYLLREFCRLETKFEKKGKKNGNFISYLMFKCIK